MILPYHIFFKIGPLTTMIQNNAHCFRSSPGERNAFTSQQFQVLWSLAECRGFSTVMPILLALFKVPSSSGIVLLARCRPHSSLGPIEHLSFIPTDGAPALHGSKWSPPPLFCPMELPIFIRPCGAPILFLGPMEPALWINVDCIDEAFHAYLMLPVWASLLAYVWISHF